MPCRYVLSLRILVEDLGVCAYIGNEGRGLDYAMALGPRDEKAKTG